MRARFNPCFLPVISAVPAIIAACIVLLYALQLLDPYRPRWTRAFITETKSGPLESDLNPTNHAPFWTYLLLGISLTGLALQIVTIFIPFHQLVAIYPSIAWVCISTISTSPHQANSPPKSISAIIILVERPRTAPISLLILYLGILLAQLVVLTHTHSSLQGEDTPTVLTLIMALFGVATVLNMPFRDPRLSKDGVSPVFGAPTVNLRSPEDNLTPWQYMTVSWMAPLISIGAKRQLNDEDVWDLGYQFKHSRLHEAFRQLRGSVIRRLLQANGLDLIIITILGIVELVARKLCRISLPQDAEIVIVAYRAC